MAEKGQIVHESETQRQYIRLNLPAQIETGGERFDVKDISSGGLAIRNANDNFKANQIIEFVLHFPFADFDLDMELKAEVLYADTAKETAGCRFIGLNQKKIAILNHVIKSFMTGDLIDAGNIIDTVSRENFVNVRQHKQDSEQNIGQKLQQYVIYGFIVLATLLIAFFIIQNILDRLFVINAKDGIVQAPQIEVLAPASGVFTYMLPEGRRTVQQGQIIGAVQSSNAATSSENALQGNLESNIKIASPCNCTIIESRILSSEYTAQNNSLFTLLPRDAEVTIAVNIPVEDVHRLNIGSRAVINILGESQEFKGTISNITMNEAGLNNLQPPSARAVIKTDQRISADLINRPASVEFHL